MPQQTESDIQHNLTGKVALITGSSRGLGKAMAIHLADRGIKVGLTYRTNRNRCLSVAEEITGQGGSAQVFQADVSQEKDTKNLVHQCFEAFGALHILINNAGPYLFRSILDTNPEEWDYIMASNLNGCYYGCFYAIPFLRQAGWGRIINLAYVGVNSLHAEPDRTPYYIAKVGVSLLTKSLAVALAKDSITVNAIAPGIIENDSYSDSFRQTVPKKIPVGRIGTPRDVIQAVDFFLDERNDYITGTCLEVSGGWRL